MFPSCLALAAGLLTAAPGAHKPAKPKPADDSLVKARKDSLERAAADTVGHRPPETILRVLRAHIPGFRLTAQKYRNQGLVRARSFAATFTIAASGDIKAIAVAKGSGNAGLDAELLDKFRRMRFDPIDKGNVTTTYSLSLED